MRTSLRVEAAFWRFWYKTEAYFKYYLAILLVFVTALIRKFMQAFFWLYYRLLWLYYRIKHAFGWLGFIEWGFYKRNKMMVSLRSFLVAQKILKDGTATVELTPEQEKEVDLILKRLKKNAVKNIK